MGKQAVKLTKGSFDYATFIAKQNDLDKFNNKFAHDIGAQKKANEKFGIHYEAVEAKAGEDYGGLENMDDLKDHVYDAVTSLLFNGLEWGHADELLSMGNSDDVDIDGSLMPTYFGIGVSTNPPEQNGLSGAPVVDSPMSVIIESIKVPKINGVPYKFDNNKFNVTDVIPTDTIDNSKEEQAYNQAVDEVNNLTVQKNNLNKQIQDINNQIKNNKRIINDLTAKISNLSNELAKAKQQKHEVEDSINTISKHISDLKSSQPVLIQAQNKATNDLNAYQQKHADAIKDYSKAKTQLDKLDDDLKLANNNKIGATQNLKQAQDKLGQINKELDIVNTQLTDLEAKVSSAKNSQIVANENLLRAQTAFNNYLAAYQDADNKLKKAKIDLATKAEEFKKAKSNYDTANTDYQITNNQIIELDRQISNLKNDINEAQAKVTKLSEIIKTKENSQNKNNKVNKIETVVNGKSNVLIISKHDDIKERPINNLKNNSSENEDTKLSDIVKINKQNNYSENNKVEVTVNRSSSTPILSKYNSMKGNQAKLSTITNENNKFNNQVINSKNNSQVSNFSKHDQTSNEKGVTTNKVKLPQTSERQGFFASLLGMFLATLGLGIFGADRSRDRKE